MGRESVPRSCCGNETECDSWFISMGYILCFVNRDFINLNFVLLLIFFLFFFFFFFLEKVRIENLLMVWQGTGIDKQ